MRRVFAVASLVLVVGCSSLFERDMVARAGDHELTVDWLAEALVDGDVLLRDQIVEKWAWMWVQYSLLLQRLSEGDSLLDTTTVREAMWPEVVTGTVELFLDRLVPERVNVDSATVDSAYHAGDQRVIDHILVRAGGHLPPAERASAERRARAIRARLAAGSPWNREARANEDYGTQSTNGRLGVIVRGQMAPEFEEVAFSLEPGGLSEVVETQFGYHVVRRPRLDELGDGFREAVRSELESRWRVGFSDQLSEQRHVRVLEDGPTIMRDAADRPIRVLALEPGRVIGTYDGGSLTDVDFVGWLQALPIEDHMRIEGSPDDYVVKLAKDAMMWEVLFLEAKSVGTTLTDSMFTAIKADLGRRIRWVRTAMRADSALANADESNRQEVTRRVLDEYVIRILTTDRDIAVVPPFLARKLRSEYAWKFSYRGLERAIARAEELTAERDTTDSEEGRSGRR